MLATNINRLYLKNGGLNEILTMSLWRFLTVLKTSNEDNRPRGGKTMHVVDKVYQSQRDMIQRTKELKK